MTTEASLKSMIIGYIIGKFSFNWFQKLLDIILNYLKKLYKWNKTAKVDRLYEKYDVTRSIDYNFYCDIKIETTKLDEGIDSKNKEQVSLNDPNIRKYIDNFNEFLFYYAREWERSYDNDNIFGLANIIHQKEVKAKIKDIIPCIEIKDEWLHGKFILKAFEKLSGTELNMIKNDISIYLFDFFGENLEQTSIVIENECFILHYVYDNKSCALIFD